MLVAEWGGHERGEAPKDVSLIIEDSEPATYGDASLGRCRPLQRPDAERGAFTGDVVSRVKDLEPWPKQEATQGRLRRKGGGEGRKACWNGSITETSAPVAEEEAEVGQNGTHGKVHEGKVHEGSGRCGRPIQEPAPASKGWSLKGRRQRLGKGKVKAVVKPHPNTADPGKCEPDRATPPPEWIQRREEADTLKEGSEWGGHTLRRKTTPATTQLPDWFHAGNACPTEREELTARVGDGGGDGTNELKSFAAHASRMAGHVEAAAKQHGGGRTGRREEVPAAGVNGGGGDAKRRKAVAPQAQGVEGWPESQEDDAGFCEVPVIVEMAGEGIKRRHKSPAGMGAGTLQPGGDRDLGEVHAPLPLIAPGIPDRRVQTVLVPAEGVAAGELVRTGNSRGGPASMPPPAAASSGKGAQAAATTTGGEAAGGGTRRSSEVGVGAHVKEVSSKKRSSMRGAAIPEVLPLHSPKQNAPRRGDLSCTGWSARERQQARSRFYRVF
jgi:hypothetical protein